MPIAKNLLFKSFYCFLSAELQLALEPTQMPSEGITRASSTGRSLQVPAVPAMDVHTSTRHPQPSRTSLQPSYTLRFAATSDRTHLTGYLLSWILLWMQIISLYVTRKILYLVELMF